MCSNVIASDTKYKNFYYKWNIASVLTLVGVKPLDFFLTNISTCVCIIYGSQSTGIENIFNNTQPHDDVLLGAHWLFFWVEFELSKLNMCVMSNNVSSLFVRPPACGFFSVCVCCCVNLAGFWAVMKGQLPPQLAAIWSQSKAAPGRRD